MSHYRSNYLRYFYCVNEPDEIRQTSNTEVRVERTLDESGVGIAQQLPGLDNDDIIVIRSKRRKRNIAAYRQGGRIVVSIPARLSKADEREIVPEMVAKIHAQENARTFDESALASRVDSLLTQFAPEITERPTSVLWRAHMAQRWGSCTSVDGTIRITDRLSKAPAYVLDFVLFHEAIHLRYGDHGQEFTSLVDRYPDHARAQAYLDGYEAAEDALIPPERP
ncbi:unannotated protein [freshwater metagenome]|uniref:Unannotated protein n=1 Tax=freshwater metagenome TaxID=449393 RepID=A0A6J7PMI9_9ZZZZ|nr:DUF45 domain-containing protein [Actinomycetota bacterium]MSW67706.1 DUF45 domain-containing protein [Actinomycetota bacterium]MSX28211.1 DUF45 domain-containing protein [Actinomycetota bacterium]MSY04198.1 DUF45 domain-containing protein [Actinomycetota bacterium]MSY20878.1 DUF45 domain-containing protein [Actinomycetota bacterium]